jgi:ribosomal protein L19
VKNKNFVNPNVTVILRNILFGTGVEFTISYFLNRLYRNISMADYKRKRFLYKSSKLFYLRDKKNRASKVK